jgi:hypothetical protein
MVLIVTKNFYEYVKIAGKSVCILKKVLYGLKKTPKAWYGNIKSFMKSLGFTKSSADPNLYFKVVDDRPIILLLYVDALFLTGVENLISECKRKTSC